MRMEMQMHDLHFHADALQNALFHAPQRNVPCPGEGGASMSAVAASLQEVRSKAREVSPSSHLFSCPWSQPVPPRTHSKPTGYVPISHHDTLDGLHGSGPVAEDGARGKGKSGQGKQQGGMGKCGYQNSRLQGGRKWKRELHPPVPPPLHRRGSAVAEAVGEGGAGVTSWWG